MAKIIRIPPAVRETFWDGSGLVEWFHEQRRLEGWTPPAPLEFPQRVGQLQLPFERLLFEIKIRP